MTSVDEFVRTVILTFPSQFSNRTEVLHHTLCVIGNGYKWSDKGDVIRVSRHLIPSSWNKEEKIAELEAEKNMKYASQIIKHFALRDLRREFKTCSKIVSAIDSRVHKRGRIKNFSPQSDYAMLMSVPANAAEDWKEACEEMKTLAEKAGWVF